MLVKTGQWYHGGMARPVGLDVGGGGGGDTSSDASSVKTDCSPITAERQFASGQSPQLSSNVGGQAVHSSSRGLSKQASSSLARQASIFDTGESWQEIPNSIDGRLRTVGGGGGPSERGQVGGVVFGKDVRRQYSLTDPSRGALRSREYLEGGSGHLGSDRMSSAPRGRRSQGNSQERVDLEGSYEHRLPTLKSGIGVSEYVETSLYSDLSNQRPKLVTRADIELGDRRVDVESGGRETRLMSQNIGDAIHRKNPGEIRDDQEGNSKVVNLTNVPAHFYDRRGNDRRRVGQRISPDQSRQYTHRDDGVPARRTSETYRNNGKEFMLDTSQSRRERHPDRLMQGLSESSTGLISGSERRAPYPRQVMGEGAKNQLDPNRSASHVEFPLGVSPRTSNTRHEIKDNRSDSIGSDLSDRPLHSRHHRPRGNRGRNQSVSSSEEDEGAATTPDGGTSLEGDQDLESISERGNHSLLLHVTSSKIMTRTALCSSNARTKDWC